MKTLILYASRHGCAEKCARILADRLGGEVTVADFKSAGRIALADTETLILGGSIHAGRIQKDVKKYIERNLAVLQAKKPGLFLCCMEEGEKAEEQFRNAFSPELIQAAKAKGLFGGEFNFERMAWWERTIIRKIAKTDVSVSKIREDRISEFAAAMKS